MIEELCEDDPARHQEAMDAACKALEARINLWDGIADELLPVQIVG
jgi:hypothetical protein